MINYTNKCSKQQTTRNTKLANKTRFELINLDGNQDVKL